MGRRRMSPRERREYERLQERKKRQLERRYAREEGIEDSCRSDSRRGDRERSRRNKRSVFGKILLAMQAFMSVAFMGMMLILGILPLKYLAVLAACLLILWSIGLVAHLRRRSRGTGGKIYMTVMTLFLAIGTFYVGKVTGALGQMAGGNLEVDIQVKNEPFSVYLSGIDVYGDVSKKSRSDVNIIATVNPETKQILLTTTPRDFYVEIPGVSKGQKDKLTHAGIYGVDASIRTLEKLYDTEIPFYARINFTSLIEIVDKLGGVDVYSEYAFKTGTDAGKVMSVSKGMNHFDGKEALAFSRERKNLPGGDNQRGKNQQAVITAMIKKMVSPSMLIKANGIIDSVSGNVETNMSKKQIQSLIKMQLSDGGSWNVYSVAAEGTGAKSSCYSSGSTLLYVTKPNQGSVEKIKDLINRVENGEILEGSEATK